MRLSALLVGIAVTIGVQPLSAQNQANARALRRS